MEIIENGVAASTAPQGTPPATIVDDNVKSIAGSDNTNHEAKGAVPYDRFQEVIGQKNDARAENEALQAQIAEMTSAKQADPEPKQASEVVLTEDMYGQIRDRIFQEASSVEQTRLDQLAAEEAKRAEQAEAYQYEAEEAVGKVKTELGEAEYANFEKYASDLTESFPSLFKGEGVKISEVVNSIYDRYKKDNPAPTKGANVSSATSGKEGVTGLIRVNETIYDHLARLTDDTGIKK